jgi:putative membrane protein
VSESTTATRPIRLHPSSVLFLLGATLRQLAGPAIAAILFSRSGVVFWIPVALGISACVALFRYLTYRVRVGDADLTVRTGVLFRNERNVPYGRIQNLNLVRNPLHRWLGVAEVQVETAGGAKPEAILRVLALDEVERLRRHVFADREEAQAAATEPTGDALVRMSARDVALFGFVSGRGLVLVAAAFGAMWQVVPDDAINRWFEDHREALPKMLAGTPLPDVPGPLLSILAGVAFLGAMLVVLRLLSVVWAFLKFHGFTLTRRGEDLRAEYGLLTRITATIPRRRVQLVHVRQSWMQRVFRVATVQVETAGGGGGGNDDGEGGVQHLWIAPLVDEARVPQLRRAVLPGPELDEGDWRPLADGAFARLARRNTLLALLATAATVGMLRWWSLAVGAILVPWAILQAWLHVRHARWAEIEGAVAYRSGWWVRKVSLVPVGKIQAVTLAETPWDRRRRMARVRVDTAGAGRVGHRVSIAYLPVDLAQALHDRLAGRVAATEFRW